MRVEVALTVVLFGVVISVLDDDAPVETEPRDSLPYTAWKRVTVVFSGALEGGELPLPGASGSARSKLAGVGGGDRNATFL